MCTIAAKYDGASWWLLKTRDPVSFMRWDDDITLYSEPKIDKIAKYLIENPDKHADGYYGGINTAGVAVVATYVPVSAAGISYLRKPYLRLLLNAETAAEAVEFVKDLNPRIGGNMFIADAEHCYLVEAAPEAYYVEKLQAVPGSSCVRTNHFLKLPYPNYVHERDPKEKAWSEAHYSRAQKLIAEAKTLPDFEALLRDREGHERGQAICTTDAEDPCYTHSAMIFDTASRTAYYSQGNPLTSDFSVHKFA
jgi:hypothetical protein